MFELPEYITLASQINECIAGKTILSGSLGNSPHKFVWYNRTHEEFAGLTQGKTVSSLRHGCGEDPVPGRRVLFLPKLPGLATGGGGCRRSICARS
jgi:hypothetical protein